MSVALQPTAESPDDPSLLLTKADLAKHLRCCERQVDNLRDVLPAAIYLGSSPRWSRAAIVQWIAEQPP